MGRSHRRAPGGGAAQARHALPPHPRALEARRARGRYPGRHARRAETRAVQDRRLRRAAGLGGRQSKFRRHARGA